MIKESLATYRRGTVTETALIQRLSPRSCTENLDQALRNYFVLAILQLPNRKSESVRIVWTPVMLGVISLTCGRVGIAPSHAAGTRTHAADAERPGLVQFLHHFRTGDF